MGLTGKQKYGTQNVKEQGVAEGLNQVTLAEQFDIIEELVESLAIQHGVDADVIWTDFEAVDDATLLETAAWKRKAGKSKSGGLNRKGVASYRREHPGSKLQTAVTTKPGKLKPGSKAAKRRKSFCARMSGVKGPMKDKHGKPTRKALALRKWNCHEDISVTEWGRQSAVTQPEFSPGDRAIYGKDGVMVQIVKKFQNPWGATGKFQMDEYTVKFPDGHEAEVPVHMLKKSASSAEPIRRNLRPSLSRGHVRTPELAEHNMHRLMNVYLAEMQAAGYDLTGY
jgi:hypothetical protein